MREAVKYLVILAGVLLPLDNLMAAKVYPLEYRFQFRPEQKRIQVTLTLERAALVKTIDFNLAGSPCSQFHSDDSLRRKGDRLVWTPVSKKSVLTYECQVNHLRKSKSQKQSYDAYMTPEWAIFRGDDMVPPARVVARKGAESRATLVFDYLKGWTAVNTGWTLLQPGSSKQKRGPVFQLNDPDRRFDRPTGWIIAGNIGTRRSYLQSDSGEPQQLAVSAPKDSSMRRMDILTFAQFVWPEFKRAFAHVPDKFLIVGANDPMWRGGLSASNSLFLHADRPIVSENGTSSLLHELVHLVTHISGEADSDWIAEGIAEYYAIELLQRAGGINAHRRQKIFARLEQRAQKIKKLHHASSTGRVTAAAVIVFRDLDNEIKTVTAGAQSLDAVVQLLMKKQKVNWFDLNAAYQKVTGTKSKVLYRSLVLKR